MQNETLSPALLPQNAWSDELDAFIGEIRQRTILWMLPILVVCAILLGASITPLSSAEEASRRLALALMIFVLVGVVWLVQRWRFAPAAWLLVLGSMALNVSVASWDEMSGAISLLAFSVGMTTLLISRRAGGLAAVICTALVLLAPPAWLPATPILRGLTVVGMWSVFGLLVAAVSPLLTATAWAWSGYQHSLIYLKQAREFQQQYQNALKDLSDANAQLLRLNQHTQGLRLMAEEERRIKEQFVANVSHELRTPLNMIIGFAEMILKAPENYSWDVPSKLLADLEVIQRNSQHLSELVNDVLDLSQIEAGRMALTRERVSLVEIVEAAVVAVRPMFESKQLSLDVELAENLPPVFCDRTRIREVVLNLLSNAGRFTEIGGVRVKALQEGRDVVVSVQDTGPGISAEDQARLFQPFQQLDNSLRRRHGGTGLGLSLSRSFVELHEGKMWLESEKGRGTTVFFRLPIEPHTPIAAGPAAQLIPGWEFLQRTPLPQLPVQPAKPQIVVVEDGQRLKTLLSRHLNSIEVVAADTVPQAIQQLAICPAQALLINQPMVSETLRQVIETDLPSGIPALICSVPETEDAANRMGADGYLVKPIAREALLQTLESLGPGIKTVLVADDEPDALQLFRRILIGAGRGYRVLRAANGRQALDIMHSEAVDVALLDLMMPEMDGFQVLAARSQEEALRKIPVILISARDPWGQPVVSKSLSVASRDGLNVQELLACIEALSAILSKARPAADPARPAAPAA